MPVAPAVIDGIAALGKRSRKKKCERQARMAGKGGRRAGAMGRHTNPFLCFSPSASNHSSFVVLECCVIFLSNLLQHYDPSCYRVHKRRRKDTAASPWLGSELRAGILPEN